MELCHIVWRGSIFCQYNPKPAMEAMGLSFFRVVLISGVHMWLSQRNAICHVKTAGRVVGVAFCRGDGYLYGVINGVLFNCAVAHG